VAGEVGGEDLAVLHDGDAVHDGPVDPPGTGRVAGLAAGEVADLLLGLELDGVGVEDEGVGEVPGEEHPPRLESEEGRRDLGDLADRLLEGPELAVADPEGQEGGRPVRSVVTVEMGSAVGDADDHGRVLLAVGHRLLPGPGLVHVPEGRLEPLVDGQVEEGVGRLDAELGGDVGDGPLDELLVLGLHHLVDLDDLPPRWRQGGTLRSVGVRVVHGVAHLVAPAGLGQKGELLRHRQAGTENGVEGGDALVEVRPRRDPEVAVEGVVAKEREDPDPLVTDVIDPGGDVVPSRPGDVDLGPAAQALEDDRQPRGPAQAFEEVAVVLVESPDGRAVEVGDRSPPVLARLADEDLEFGQGREP